MGGSLVGLGVLKADSLDVPGLDPSARKANAVCARSLGWQTPRASR
jgi:hypothetical protein